MCTLPDKNVDYNNKNYWEDRYEHEESFDWFTSYETFRNFIISDVEKNSSILMLGCGNSSMSAAMYEDGYRNITNLDYSEVVISNMASRHQHMPEMSWVVMDMLNMTFPDQSFDVIIEKGTLDAMLVGEITPWRLSPDGEQMMTTILGQVSQLLRPGGAFISVTFGQPHFRKPVYARPEYGWNITTRTFGETFHFFYYKMTKGESLSEEDHRYIAECKKRSQTPSPTRFLLSDSEDEEFLNKIEVL